MSWGAGIGTEVVLITSPQRHQVGNELIELRTVELQGRHEGSGLERAWVLHPGAEVVARVAHGAGAERGAAHQVSQVRAEHAVARSPADAMTVDARQRGKELAACSRRRLLRRRCLLRSDPRPELALRMDDYDEEHQRVLDPRIRLALTDI